MTEKITAIVIDITRHNDKLNIVTLFTRSRGRISFLSPAGSGKMGRLRHSRLQPLAAIEADINFRQTAELQRLGTFALYTVWNNLYFAPVKRLVALFISEFLNKLLRATMPDEALWDFILNSISLLDNLPGGIANFHIAFLSSLLPFAGIQPDHTKYREGYMFDMQSGTFSPDCPVVANHELTLHADAARMAATLCRINFANMHALRLSRHDRQRVIQGLLTYYSIHFPGAGNLRSLEIIREIFD